MNGNDLINIIMRYKDSLAFITAYEIGLLKKLHERKGSLKDICDELKLNAEYTSLLLKYLERMNIVSREKDAWILTSDLEEKYSSLEGMKDIIKHEKNILQRWMTPDRLEQALYSKIGERSFDASGFTKEDQVLYDGTMYGTNLRLIGIHLMRELRKLNCPNIMEYGRSGQTILMTLKQLGYKFNGICMPESSLIENSDAKLNGSFEILCQNDTTNTKFDVAIVYNTIHYYDKECFSKMLFYLKRRLNNNGIVFIIDIFLDEDNDFSFNVLLDWITHGGVNFINSESVIEMINKNNYSLARCFDIKNINASVIMASI